MADVTALSNQLNEKKRQCRAIIETPKGCRNKFDYDPDSSPFMLGGLLPEGMMFPFDFGFIPSTLGDDGDPLDIMVLMDAPAHVGCLIDVRIIGIIDAEQTEDGKTEKTAVFSAPQSTPTSTRISKPSPMSARRSSLRSRNFLFPTTSSAAKNSESPTLAGRRKRSPSSR